MCTSEDNLSKHVEAVCHLMAGLLHQNEIFKYDAGFEMIEPDEGINEQ